MKLPKNPFSRRLSIALVVMLVAYAFCLELCARQDAALVVLGAGNFARISAVVGMLSLLVLRLVLFVLMPAYLAGKLVLSMTRPAPTTTS